MFAHYRLGVDLPLTKVVDRSKGARTKTGVREVMIEDNSAYEDVSVEKVAGQGAFDNIHMAPEMVYQQRAAAMAPICQHDCLHMHWRWSKKFGDKPVLGFSDGAPYSKPGAPLIPENQDLSVSLTDTTFTYVPEAKIARAGEWQIFMHHGGAYVVSLNPPGAFAPRMEADGVAELVSTPPPWERFYYHNQFHESLGADRNADRRRVRPGSGKATFIDMEEM